MTSYNPQPIIDHYNTLAEREWERLVANPLHEVSLHVHSHYVRRFIQPGMRVLEVGAGPGRFTLLLAELGARVVVSDLSPVQLELNRENAAKYGFAQAVEDWRLLDICDLAGVEDGAFDAVLAYGGPLSYALDRRAQAVVACRRVLRPGGVFLCSVMSQWGTCHRFLDGVLALDPLINQAITTTGDLTKATNPAREGHFMHMFRAAELRRLLEDGGFAVQAMSASAVLSIGWEQMLSEKVRPFPERWAELLRMEVEAAAEEQALNMGTHLIAGAVVNG
jgi:SAM-dependent methyltransferase